MMKRLLRTLICAVLFVAGAVQAGNEASRELAQKVFREATGWKEYRLSADTVLLRGRLEKFNGGGPTHMYCAVSTKEGKPQLCATYAVAAGNDQFARFSLKAGVVQAYHANGVLLARIRLWDAPPAQFATAPSLVSLRLVGVEPGVVIAEAENLTGHPVTLRRGKVYVIEYEGNEVKRSDLTLRLKECRLQPGQTARMKLSIISKRQVYPAGWLERQRVELVYRAQDNQPCGAELSPAWVLQSGVPQLDYHGYSYPIRLRNDLAVHLEPGMSGMVMHRLAIYQLSGGVWFHSGWLNTQGNSAPCAFEIGDDMIRVRDSRGRLVGLFVFPQSTTGKKQEE
jgi:hypothetical protein